MKKLFYIFILVVGFSSSAIAEDEFLGTVKAYKSTLTISLEDCLKNTSNSAGVFCCGVTKTAENIVSIFDNYMDWKRMEVNKDVTALLTVSVNKEGYEIRITSSYYSQKAGFGSPTLTKEEYVALIQEFLKEKGDKISVKLLKIEK